MPILKQYIPNRKNKPAAGVTLSRDLRSKKNPFWVQWKKKDDIRKNTSFTSLKEAEEYYSLMVEKVKASIANY